MTPLFGVRMEISGIAPLRALEKLSAAGIRARDVRKEGVARLNFCVKSKETEKIFAIFARSCYTVTRKESVGLTRLAAFLRRRPGIPAGGLAAVALAASSNLFVLRICVTGSAARYAERAEEILAEAGLSPFSLYSEGAAEAAEAALLTLPGVVFASVGKEGCVLTVTLEESAEAPAPAQKASLAAPRSGVIEELTVLRGTPLVAEGDSVAAGQTLVGGYFLTEAGEQRQTPAVARCSLLCTYEAEFVGAADSEQFRARSVAAARLRAGGELVSSSYTVREEAGGYVCAVSLVVRVRVAVNMGSASG